MDHDAVIVGASFAGLACAATLAGRGAAVTVLEARRDAGETFGAGRVLDPHPATAPPEHAGLAVGTFDVHRFGILQQPGARWNR